MAISLPQAVAPQSGPKEFTEHPLEEGVFVLPTPVIALPSDWQFEHGIADISMESTEPVKHLGAITVWQVIMEDGSVYKVYDGCPSIQRADTAQVKTTPYQTRADRGLNRHHQIKDMELGFRALLISRELEWQGDLSQARTAHNMLLIAKALLEEDGSVDPVNMEFGGISRSAMEALGAKALSALNPDYGINVFYFSAIAPCFPRPYTFNLGKLAKAPAQETVSLLYHLGRLPVGLLLRYPGTLDPNLAFGFAAAKALTNGEAGEFVPHIPKSPIKTQGYVRAYPEDLMGMGKTWQADFEDHAGVVVDLAQPQLGGLASGHLQVISRSDLQEDIERHKRLRDELKRVGSDTTQVDYQYVNLAA